MVSWNVAVERERSLKWAEYKTPVSLVIKEGQIQET